MKTCPTCEELSATLRPLSIPSPPDLLEARFWHARCAPVRLIREEELRFAIGASGASADPYGGPK